MRVWLSVTAEVGLMQISETLETSSSDVSFLAATDLPEAVVGITGPFATTYVRVVKLKVYPPSSHNYGMYNDRMLAPMIHKK